MISHFNGGQLRPALVLGALMILVPASWTQVSVHQAQMEAPLEEYAIVTDDALAAAATAAKPQEVTAQPVHTDGATPTIDDGFIVFGYIQDEDVVYHLRWQSLTHIGSLFVNFDASGNISSAYENLFLNRSSYLRAGGAAEAAGVKVIIVLLNSFDNAITESVFTSPTNRATLISEITNLINQDAVVNGSRYVHGVSFDLEPFAWSASATAGLVTFFGDLRTAFDAIDPSLEISIYGDPTPISTQWDIPNMEPNLDYILYSCYDFATGNTPTAISRFRTTSTGIDYLTAINDSYLDLGLPPEKMVPVLSSYSRQWNDSTAYGVVGNTPVPRGFTDGLYNVTLNPNFGGPYTDNYQRSHEVGWNTWNDGTDRIMTWEAPEALEYEIRHVLSNQDDDGVNNGQRLGGVGFWSLMWFAEQSSYDMNTSGPVPRTRTYPHGYQLCQEILAPPGTTQYLIDGFEGLDYRWQGFNPNTPDFHSPSPDNVNVSTTSTRSIATAPAGSGRPASTTNAMRVDFVYTGSAPLMFFRHEVLASPLATSVADLNAVAAVVDSTTLIRSHIQTPASYSGRTVRMVLVDGDGELETSDTYTLAATGWRELAWDLTDPTEINGYTTSEVPFSSGDGVLDTAGGGAKDIGFVGFLIEGGVAGSGTIYFDEVTYEHHNPGGLDYVINEFRYDDAASEFIEIHGPAGAFPANTEVRFYDPSDGSVLSSVSLTGQSVPANGFFVIGDTGVPNVDLVPAGWSVGDDIPDVDPSSIQIYNTTTGCVYDSVVYEAMGGLNDLIRLQTHGVTGEGYPWLGRIGPGTDGSGAAYTQGRYPDGADSGFNRVDFGSMVATPGASNGGSVTLNTSYDFISVPAGLVQTFQSPTVADPTGAGLPLASVGSGNAYRCIDTTGGGVQAFLGDASLGDDGLGYTVEGDIYIPSSAAPVQAIAIGLCGSQGTTFFSDTTDNAAYEDGYWLIYENATGVGLNDGRADHPGVFEFVHATNDNMDANRVELLGSATRVATGAPNGGWTSFSLMVNPPLTGQQLIIQINGTDIYRGDLPAGGPTSGAFQVGFRENHVGAPATSEGTWIDNVAFVTAVPVELSVFNTD